jgi:hypothetical protein
MLGGTFRGRWVVGALNGEGRLVVHADAWIADLQKKMQQKHLERLKSLGKRSDFQYESAHHLVAHVNRVLYDILPHSDSKVSPSVPASLGSLFKGRENWFARIRQQIKKARGADSVRVVLHGIGGIGKTQLVSEYAMAYAHEYSVAHLIRGDSKESFDAGLAELCRVLDLPQSDSVNPKEQIKAALSWLEKEENKSWMLLIDNIDDETMINKIVDLSRKARSSHPSGELNLAESLSILCQTLNGRGYFDRALEAGQEQRKILEELCTKEPENLAHRRELGISCFWVGSALAKSQRWQESAAAFEQAIKATQAVIDAGGSFGSLGGDLDFMTSRLQHVRDQINKK